jgi:predicted regulator of amino acid metabolism with ACT domain
LWGLIKDEFDGYPAQERVARLMMEHGLSVKGGRIYCGDVRLSATALADASGTDRRAVNVTVTAIEGNRKLRRIFENLLPTCSFKTVAPQMGWGVLEILPEDVSSPGIISRVTTIIADEGISIRQAMADDPQMHQNPRAFIITERPIPARLLPKIKSLKGVRGVVIL